MAAVIQGVLLRPADISMLSKYAKGAKCAVEIGTFMGGSACVIRGVIDPEGVFYCIDPYYPIDPIDGQGRVHHVQGSFAHARENVRVNPNGYVAFLEYESRDAARFFRPGQIDFLFIDGVHTYTGVKFDFETYLPLMAPGGLMLFHDAAHPDGEPGPLALTNELLGHPGLEFVEQSGLIRAFKKL